jgi:hypothetical protein
MRMAALPVSVITGRFAVGGRSAEDRLRYPGLACPVPLEPEDAGGVQKRESGCNDL